MQTFCRVCFTLLFDVRHFPHDAERKRKQFKYITEIQIDNNEIFSFELCENCTEVLQRASQFKKKCRSSDKLIQNYLANNIDCDVPGFLAFIRDAELTNHRVEANRDCEDKESVCTSIKNFMSDMLQDEDVAEAEATLIQVIKEELDDSIDSCWLQLDENSPFLDVDKYFSPYLTPSSEIPEKTLIDPKLLLKNDSIGKSQAIVDIEQYVDVTNNEIFNEFELTEPPKGSSTPLQHVSIDEISNCENKSNTQRSSNNEIIVVKTKRNSRRILKCEVCDVIFTQMSQLSTHTFRDHGVKLKSGYKRKVSRCEHCDKLFADPSNFRRHLVTHKRKEDKIHVCNICQLEFKQLNTFKLHSRTHKIQSNSTKTDAGDIKKKFLCTVCGTKCTTHSNYVIHCRRHEKAFSISCDICERNFYRTCDLKVHKRTHTGEKPYHCKQCPAKFARSDKLARHMKVHEARSDLHPHTRPTLAEFASNAADG